MGNSIPLLPLCPCMARYGRPLPLQIPIDNIEIFLLLTYYLWYGVSEGT
jgi:hypothetical protein